MTRTRQTTFELTPEAVILLEKMALDKEQSMTGLIEHLIALEFEQYGEKNNVCT